MARFPVQREDWRGPNATRPPRREELPVRVTGDDVEVEME